MNHDETIAPSYFKGQGSFLAGESAVPSVLWLINYHQNGLLKLMRIS